ncbi:hypothetical protein PYW07_013390 [Mythimna separata]|uniref:Uncharacterized protein n=1 Tax=Mythimna separata TaxID=271217 RepID=A0AAD8DKE1_MYTSE|nr:hypothetical protein PYW07_013390 [Mythimna separata]
MNSQIYKKRAGTSGIQGQLYETKLMSLIYFRLLHDDSVEQFSLAANRDDIGAFDDICIIAKVKEFDKILTVFIQAKHRENDKQLTFTGKADLAKYFGSYLEIRRAFEPTSKDVIFGRKFEETECFFVMYTTAKDDPKNKVYEGTFAEYLDELIGTGGCCTQSSYTDEDLDFLCKITMEEQITTLAEQLAKFICDESVNEMSMHNDIMLRYHVILALNVFEVSEIQPEGHRIASFREDFFTTNDEFIVLIKNILCVEVLKKQNSEETDVQNLLFNFLREPSDVTTLSKLLKGSVLKYKNDKLEFVSKSITDDLKRQLDKANVPQSIVYEAAELAAKEYLLSLKLKVPAFFGNKDLAIRGNDKKIQKRLNHLTTTILEILEQSKPNHVVTIDESLGDGFLQLNGGIASAVANILVFDETSKLLKFTDTCESLGKLAKTWYEMLNSKIPNLHEYRLDVKVKKFPKLSFERGEYDLSLVREFYNKLLFYTNQADQNGVEDILRGEIEDNPCNDVKNFRDRSGLIFLKYHDEIQKLWMTPKVGSYLNQKSKIYENAVTYAMNESLMGVLNKMHNIKNLNYTFTDNAIERFDLIGQILGGTRIIASESCILTLAKVEQYLGNKNYVVLDLEYIFKLPLKSHNTLCQELTNTAKEMVLIIICNCSEDFKKFYKRLENIAKAITDKQTIIITNQSSVDVMTQYFAQASQVWNDERNTLTDLTVESQKKFLATSKIKFQGETVSLDMIVDDESVKFIDEDVFYKLINNETVDVGNRAFHNNYEKQFYIDRRVSRTKKQEHDKFDDVKDKLLETLYDLKDDVVLISARPATGMSTLLIHLSLNTKELDPKVWIVRINLEQHKSAFRKKKEDNFDLWNTKYSTSDSLKFMCRAVLEEVPDELNEDEEVSIELEESESGTVSLVHCSGGSLTVFQLKMFLHYYNRGKLILIFDGIDEMEYSFVTESLYLMESVRDYNRRHKIWIAKVTYDIDSDDDEPAFLEKEFGTAYELEPFTALDGDIFLNKFWKHKIQFKNLNKGQLQNVHDFVRYMLNRTEASNFSALKQDYLRAYVNFLEFLKTVSSASDFDFPLDEYNIILKRLLDCCENKRSALAKDIIDQLPSNFGTCVNKRMYRIADYFRYTIKHVERDGDPLGSRFRIFNYGFGVNFGGEISSIPSTSQDTRVVTDATSSTYADANVDAEALLQILKIKYETIIKPT